MIELLNNMTYLIIYINHALSIYHFLKQKQHLASYCNFLSFSYCYFCNELKLYPCVDRICNCDCISDWFIELGYYWIVCNELPKFVKPSAPFIEYTFGRCITFIFGATTAVGFGRGGGGGVYFWWVEMRMFYYWDGAWIVVYCCMDWFDRGDKTVLVLVGICVIRTLVAGMTLLLRIGVPPKLIWLAYGALPLLG